MQLSVQRLRWVLIAGALLLVVVLAAFIGYGRYRALKTYSQLLKRNGITVTHETDGLTISQSLQGKTNFTIHSAKAVQLGDGKWLLHDAVMTFYGRVPNAVDHLYGSEVEYDEKLGVARAKGEVHMDLQAPQALAGGGHARAGDAPVAKDDALIHVRTSGLVYLRKLGVAATDQPVEFRYGSVLCTARGAEFNPGQSTLRLLADVVMNAQMHGQPVQVTAVRADMDRTMNIANLTLPVVTSLGRTARADAATLTLRPDGSIEHVQAGGRVVFRADTPHAGTRQITAARLDATLTAQTLPQTARLSGGVVLTDDNPLRPMHGSATQVDATFTEQGTPASVTATGAAKIAVADKRAQDTNSEAGLMRELQAEKIVAMFVPGAKRGARSSTQLRLVIATGAAKAHGESAATAHKGTASGGLKSTLVAGDELRMAFGASSDGHAQPQTLLATGHTLLQQDAPLHEEQSSTGDRLEMSFASASKTATKEEFAISSALQTGHVVIRDHAPDRTDAKPGVSAEGAVSTGGGERATYDGATQTLTLTGGAHLTGDNATLTAQRVVMDRQTNVSEAFGDVRATLENAPATGPAAKPQSATHVLAASARFEHNGKLATFRGTDVQPARLWQDASQVQAANLIFDGEHHTFSARPANAGTMIHAVFAGAPANKPANKPAANNIVRVASPRMDYSDVQREATFSGGVQMDGTLGEVRSQRALVYLTPTPLAGEKKAAPTAQPSPFSGSLDRVLVLGDVQLEQPGRHGSGEQLLYTAATGDSVLTGTAGHPPQVVDAQQGSITGTTLTFGGQGSTIVVTGGPGSTAAKHERVRTETEVRQ